MAFDAGSITASLSVDTAKADADLRKIEQRVKDLESGRHEIKISAVFDDASTGKARAAFASLDNAISRDAMQRLRSSPQGSVLGALNALFSPHPVSGAPSPQQSASQGLLGKILAPQGGGSTPVSGGSSSTVREVLTGQNAPQKVTVTTQGGGGGGVSPQAARDLENAAAAQKAAADDLGNAADSTKSAARDMSSASSGIRGVLGGLKGIFGGGGGGSGGTAGAFGKGLAGGIGPGILGLGAKSAFGVAGVGSLLGSLPALLAPLAALGVGGAGAGVLALGAKTLIGTKNQAGAPATQGPLYNQAQTALTSLTSSFKDAASVLIGPLKQAFAEIPGLMKGIEPALKSVFAGAATLIQPLLGGVSDIAQMVLPALGKAFAAAAPLMRPLLDGLGSLVAKLLPGVTTLLHAAMPAVTAFGQILGTLGSDIGKMFAYLAPAIKASVQIFQPLMSIISALFPIVGKLAAVFASALGPVFSQFASVVQSLMPALTIFGKVLASLAGAVLGDLVSAFTAVAQLLKGIAPSLTVFATALSSAFTVLENTGVFAELGDALENLAPLLAQMISQLLDGLTPVLPQLITSLSQMSSIIVTALASGLQQILPPLTQLALVVLQALAASLPVVLPVLAHVFAFFTTATADAVTGIVKALSGFVNVIPKPALDTLAGLAAALLILKKTGVISLGIKIIGIAKNVLNWLTGAAKSATVDVAAAGMQKAGDTMVAAAEAMQKAASTMAGAGAEEATAGTEQAAAGTEEVAAGGLMASGLGGALTAALPALGALTIALVAFEALKSGSNILNFFKPPGSGGGTGGAAAALSPGGTSSGAFTSQVPQPVVNQAKAQNAAANASAQAQSVTSLLAAGKAAQATTAALAQLNAAFGLQSASATAASSDLAAYTKSVKDSGTASQASKLAADQLISDLEIAGVQSSTAQADVSNYTNAIAQNGISSSQAQAAREQLITDILNAGSNAQQGQTALQSYTSAVQDDGAKSAAAQGARAQLIRDLENAGVSAQGAQQLVDQLTTAIKDLPAGKNVNITMTGDGSFTITQGTSGHAGGTPTGGRPGNAAGGYIAQGTGPTADDVPIMASRGEYVVKASSVSKYGTPMMDAINAGAFAQGGMVGGNLTPGYVSGMYNDFQGQMTAAMVAAMRASLKAAEAAAAKTTAAAGAGGGAVANGATITAALKSLGITGTELADALKIIQLESGGSLTAQNPASSAYGIAQFINGPSEYYTYGGNPNTVAGQITAFVNYVKQRYGTFANALAFHLANGYYAAGGLVGAFPRWFGPVGGPGGGPGGLGGLGGLQGLAGMMSGASGGSANPLAGTAFVGNYTGVVSPASGGFGITRTQLGLPPPASTSSSSSAGGSSAGSASGTAGTTPAPAASKPAAASLNAAQKAAIAVLENLMGGLIRDNKTGEAAQANALLNSVGVTKYNHQLSQISFLDSQLAKARSKGAKTAAEKLLESFGVHVFTPQGTAHGNAPKSAVITRMESLVKAAITANNMTGAGQANSILTALGTGKYTSELSAISHLDSLLAQYKAKKDTKDINATEALLRTYGVRHFAQGGTVWEPVVGFGQRSGGVYQFAEHGPETVTPGAQGGGGDMVSELRMLRGQMDKLIQTTASVPHGVTSGIGSALGGAAQSASFGRRYHGGG